MNAEKGILGIHEMKQTTFKGLVEVMNRRTMPNLRLTGEDGEDQEDDTTTPEFSVEHENC
jgi:hypothetical protein